MKIKLAIDPGHGYAGNHGALLDDDLHESSIVLAIALRAERYLERLPLIDTRLTRWAPVGVDYSTRAAKLRRYAPDLVVCLHCDASPDPDTRGSFALARQDDEAGADCAATMLANMPAHLAPSRATPFHAFPKELKEHWTNRAHWVLAHYDFAPAFLVELGRLTHDADARALTGGTWIDFIAHAIASAAMRRLDQKLRGV